jgi:hypothetical protein
VGRAEQLQLGARLGLEGRMSVGKLGRCLPCCPSQACSSTPQGVAAPLGLELAYRLSSRLHEVASLVDVARHASLAAPGTPRTRQSAGSRRSSAGEASSAAGADCAIDAGGSPQGEQSMEPGIEHKELVYSGPLAGEDLSPSIANETPLVERRQGTHSMMKVGWRGLKLGDARMPAGTLP